MKSKLRRMAHIYLKRGIMDIIEGSFNLFFYNIKIDKVYFHRLFSAIKSQNGQVFPQRTDHDTDAVNISTIVKQQDLCACAF